jgi:uncharacterized protein YndB with AHSA1/START domain
MTTTTQPAITAKRDVTLSRVIAAPRARVFRAWTDPKQMAQWWGPQGFTNPVCEIDARQGGQILIHMRGPDGVVYPMTGTFHEVVEPSRLVFTAFAEDHDGNRLLESHTIVTFEEQDGKTTVAVQAKAVGLAPQAPQMLAGMDAGWTQSLERLAALAAAA